MRAHYRTRHPDVDLDRLTMAELCTAEPGRPPKPKEATVGVALAALAVVPPTPTELPPLDVEDVDQIVLGLVDQLAGPAGVFPVAHLPALLAWRTATETFLRSVTRSSG